MKRLIALVLVLVFSMMAISAFADDCHYGHKFRFEGGEKKELNYYKVWDDPDVSYYTEFPQVESDLCDLLGYYPNSDIDYSERDNGYVTIYFYLYQTMVEIEAPITVNGMILVPWFELPEDVIAINDLTQLLPKKERETHYNILGLTLAGCRIEEINAGNLLKLTVSLECDNGKSFEVSALDYTEKKGKYYVLEDEFRQLFYEIYGRF